MNTQVHVSETAPRYAWFRTRNKIREPDPSIKASPGIQVRIRRHDPVSRLRESNFSTNVANHVGLTMS